MPSKNRIKKYLAGTAYHIYNRGIDGREIFNDEEDYQQLLQIFKKYLVQLKPEVDSIYKKERPYILRHRQEMNLYQVVELLAICLMPDHFHLLLWQKTTDGMKNLMRRALTNYVMYYNRKYKRSGPLFENVYRAVMVSPGEQAVILSKYIHLNPVSKQVKRYGLVETVSGNIPEYYMYSSYGNYLGKEAVGVDQELIQSKRIMEWFEDSKWGGGENKAQAFRKFMEEQVGNWHEVLGGLLLE